MVSISSKSEVFEFSGGGGGRSPQLGVFHVTCDTHFRTQMSYSGQKSCVKIWFGLVEPFRVIIWIFQGRQKPPVRGVTCDLRCPFSNLAELFQSKVICENLVRIGWAFQELSCPQTFFWGSRNPLLRGVTFDLWCPFSNSDEIFQSKVMCENLVWIGWNRRDVNFEGGGRPPNRGGGVTCDLRCQFSNLAEVF